MANLMSMLNEQIKPLDEAAKEAAEKHEKARLLMTQPGVGPITSLAFVLTMGDVKRFTRSKQVASYLGLIPREYSSGGRQRLGSISKEGSTLARFLLGQLVMHVLKRDSHLRTWYLGIKRRRGAKIGRVAVMRRPDVAGDTEK